MPDKRKRRWLIAAGITGICACAAVFAYGYWSVSGTAVNFLTMASYRNQIEEEYEVPHHVDPSEEITKVVNVSNTGTVDTFVRVRVEKEFGERRADGSFCTDDALDPEMIEIEFHKSWWLAGDDGYFYYRGILKAGETTKEPLFSSYRLSAKAGNEYQGKDARILVTMESVQAQGDALSTWGITYRDLDVSGPKEPAGKDTSVTYLGRELGFDITSKRTDLFASFKNLLPGCARTQKIYVHNDSAKEAGIFLRAEAVSQDTKNSEQKKLVEQMLEKYALIRILDGKNCIYDGPVSGNLSGSPAPGNVSTDAGTMKRDISLGTLPGGGRKELTVTLSLSPEMDNQYQSLTGKVKWVFTAAGEDEQTVNTAVVPQTGDGTRSGMWIALLLTSAVFLAGAAWVARRNKRMDKRK